MYKECRHIKSEGTKCHSHALTDKPYCYFHARLHRLKSKPGAPFDSVELPVLEDRSAIQLALSQVLSALGSSRLDAKRAGLFLYGLQIASQNVDHGSDVVPECTVEVLTSDSDGDEMAPEETVCEAPQDCCKCEEKETCEFYDPNDCDLCGQNQTCEEYINRGKQEDGYLFDVALIPPPPLTPSQISSSCEAPTPEQSTLPCM